jgi:hypothetical protein
VADPTPRAARVVTITCTLETLHQAERALAVRADTMLQAIDMGLPTEQYHAINAKFEAAAAALHELAHATLNNTSGRPGWNYSIVQLTDAGRHRHRHLHPQRAFPVSSYTAHADGHGYVAHVWYIAGDGMPAIQSLSHGEYEDAKR